MSLQSITAKELHKQASDITFLLACSNLCLIPQLQDYRNTYAVIESKSPLIQSLSEEIKI